MHILTVAAISPMQKVKVVQTCDKVEQGGDNVVIILFTMHNYGDKMVTKL